MGMGMAEPMGIIAGGGFGNHFRHGGLRNGGGGECFSIANKCPQVNSIAMYPTRACTLSFPAIGCAILCACGLQLHEHTMTTGPVLDELN